MSKTKKQLADEAALGREIKSDVDRGIILRRNSGSGTEEKPATEPNK